LPIVPPPVVDLVSASLEDVERGLVLMAVAPVGAAGEQLDEVHLDRLGKERVISGTEDPGGAGLVRIPGVGDRRIVDDGAGAAHAGRRALPPAELFESVGLGADPPEKHPTFAFAHPGRLPPDPLGPSDRTAPPADRSLRGSRSEE